MEEASTKGLTLFLMISSSIIFHSSSYAMDIVNSTRGLRVGETLVSSGGTFELGFFTPGNTGNQYLGIWYRNTDNTAVWVANRGVPITNSTGVVLNIIEPGILVLVNESSGVIWSSNSSVAVQNPIAQLLDSGNLVVRDANDDRPENFIWQSFDYPTDAHLPGMRFGWNLVTGLESYLSSWRGVDDPAPGEYSFHLDATGFPQVHLKRGNVVLFRIGPWNGLRFSGTADSRGDPTYRATFVMNANEVSFGEILVDRSSVARFTLNQSGVVQRLIWVDRRGWTETLKMPTDICDNYRMCGENAICNVGNSPACGCLDRFVPRDPEGWVRTDWTNGCVRRRNLSCGSDVFLRYSGIKLPDARNSWYNTSMTLHDCREECSRDCSCTAYTQLDISRGSGCLIWYGTLIDIRSVSLNGQDIYIRMASSESADSEGRKRAILIASLAAVTGVVLIGLGLFFYIRKRNDQQMKGGQENAQLFGAGLYDASHQKDPELPSFDLAVILTATENFSLSNKIGEGGFGIVYKGVLEGGQEIAVKRLSKDSMQGIDEFKNEVIFIAKLQHRNLVRLLGCCIRGEENMLIYEYMPNKSLDNFLFDETRRMMLDWPKRFHIINGIARGLLYLHQDSRLRIIHRDLKASNVLLDSEMNPKISDFGMARSFGGNETADQTQRVVGTYGYMAPEYAVDGLFSVKSDVFSFGVLILEIVSGKRNRGFSDSDHSLNLLGHAWTLYKEGRSLELADMSIAGSIYLAEVLRSVHVGLLCVQQNAEDRPSMSTVVQMLGKEGLFPEAKQPGFFAKRNVSTAQNSTSTDAACSTNEMTITLLEAR